MQEAAAAGSGALRPTPPSGPGWGAEAARRPGPLSGQFADDSDEGAVLIFQPLVVGLQLC